MTEWHSEIKEGATLKTWKWVEEYRDLIVGWIRPVNSDYIIAVLSNGTEIAIRD